MILTIRAFRTTNLSAKAIHLGDYLYENKQGLNHIKSFNHWEVGYSNKTSGSIKEGTITRNFNQYLSGIKCELREWELELNSKQWRKCKSYLDEAENKPYETAIFALYPLSLIFGKWLGKTDMSKLFCVEHAVRAINSTDLISLPFNIWPTALQRELDNSNLFKQV